MRVDEVFCWARAELIGAAKVCKLGGVAGTSTRWIMIATHTCSDRWTFTFSVHVFLGSK